MAGLRAKLTDRSPAGLAASKAATADQLNRLKKIDRASLSGIEAVNYDCVAYVLEQRDHVNKRYDFGAPWDRSPYVVSQLTGAYQSIPTFLDTKHRIEDAADIDSYIARMEGFAAALTRNRGDEARCRPRYRAARFHPRHHLDPARKLSTRATSPSADLAASPCQEFERAAARRRPQGVEREDLAGAGEAWGAVKQAREKATHDAGVWHIKDGESWYADYLQISTTTKMTPDEIHKWGSSRLPKFPPRWMPS